jgi:uncharacterized membrane protein
MDTSQPQTLQGAVLFSYMTAAFALLYLLIAGAPIYLVPLLLAATAYGIANERRFAYRAAVVLACLYLLGQFLYLIAAHGAFGAILNMIFAGVLVALLLHPESRQYQRIWFH